MAVHHWWHLALFQLEVEGGHHALETYDGHIARGPGGVSDLIDASALLWRLSLCGFELAGRWCMLAERWEPHAADAYCAFNDVHAMMAFVGARRADLAQAVLDAQAAALGRADDNARFTAEVGRPVTNAIVAFGEARYAETVRLLRPVRNIANRFGGSNAQRDLLDLTLIEAAFRSGQDSLAAALAAERIAIKPASPLARLFVERSAGMAKAA